MLGGRGIYTPNLIIVFQECPSSYYEGQDITSGVFGNFTRWDSPNWTLLLESCTMALGNLWQEPSAGFVTFRLYCLSPPCRPLSPEGSGRRLRVHDLDGFLEPSPTGSDCRPLTSFSNLRQPGAIVVPALTDQRRKNDSLWLAKVTIFDEPSGSATFARGRSPTIHDVILK